MDDEAGRSARFTYSVAIASGKGGVGKSTVAVNVAVVLAQEGATVGLLDADVYGPNCHIMLGVDKLPPPRGKTMIPAVAHGVNLISMGLLVDPQKPLAWRGPMLHSAIRQFVEDVDWGNLDFLIVDLPPGTGDAQLSVAQTISLCGGFVVTLPQAVSVADARRGLELFRQLRVPVLGVIENMSYLSTPDGLRLDVFGQGGGQRLSEDTNVPFLGEIPLDPAVRIGSDEGKPIVVAAPDSPSAVSLRNIATAIAEKSRAQLQKQPASIPIEVIE